MNEQEINSQENYLISDSNDSESYRSPNQNEIESLLHYNPKINLQKILVLDEGFVEVEDDLSPLCEQFDCLNAIEEKVFDKVSGEEIKSLTLDLRLDRKSSEELCSKEEYFCQTDEKYVATFNCLGWGLGILKWLSPSIVNNYIEEGYSKKEALTKFIAHYHKEFPCENSANFECITDKLKILDSKPEVITKNLVIFFFKNNSLTHASRSVELEDEVLWSSKMGYGSLLTHQESENFAPQLYGTEVIYAGLDS